MEKTRKQRLSDIEKMIADHPKNRAFRGSQQFMDPTPVAPPVGYEKQPSMIDIIKQQVAQVSLSAQDEGFETIDDANDFEVDDDPFPSSPYEFTEEEFEVPPSIVTGKPEPPVV